MTPDQRRRAGLAIRNRIAELDMTLDQLAYKAALDPTTVRAVVNGRRWPRERTRQAICEVLGWEFGDIMRRAIGVISLRDATLIELVDEMCSRMGEFRPNRELIARHAETP